MSLLLLSLDVAHHPCSGADLPPDEAQLIRVLESSGSNREKDAACATLKKIGTQRSVPALAQLLPNPELSHSARYVLESMPYREASAALVGALPRTSGSVKAGIIHSLQIRRDDSTVPALAGVLMDSDETVSCAAAEALGDLVGRDAREVLERRLRGTVRSQPLRLALADSLLKIAQAFQNAGERTEALSVYRRFTEAAWPEHIRLGAWRGVFLTSGTRGLDRMIEALRGDEEPARTAALSLVPIISTRGTAAALARALPKLEPAVQVAVLGSLAQRGDPAAANQIASLTDSGTPETRTAALAALGALGDASHVRLLADKAASTSGLEQSAARQALAQLRRGAVSEELTKAMGSSPPKVQSELARALGERLETAAAPALLELARADEGPAVSAAFQALGAIAGPQHVAALVELVLVAKSDERRAQAAETLNTATQRQLASRGQIDTQPLLAGLKNGSPPARASLLRVCSGIVSGPVRETLRQAVESSDQTVRKAGISAMSDTVDPELLPDLTTLAIRGTDPQTRNLALAGVVRLWSQEEPARVPHAEKIHSAKTLAASRLPGDQWRKLLAGLAEIPDPEVVPLIQAQLGSADLRNEAARALVRLCASLPQTDSAREALASLDLASLDEGTRSAAVNTLKQLEARLAFLTAWQVAGPYRQSGKNFSELFDLPFGPEATGGVPEWKPGQLSGDPAKPYVLDFLKMFGGEQCVAYARTELQAETGVDGVLEIGSDDGIKVWLNGTVVHANNTARPLQPGQDKARIHLKPGRNELLIKLTQNNAGWELCVKLVNQEGRLIPGLTQPK